MPHHTKSGPMHPSTPKSISKIVDLEIIGTTKVPYQDTSNVPSSPTVTKYAQDKDDQDNFAASDVEVIKLTPIDLLHQATEFRNPTFYYQALTLDAEKRKLQERADQLKHRLDVELRIKARKLASRYYGWTDVPWKLPMQCNLNDMWGALRSLSNHEYALQDPNISNEFFENLRNMMVHDDLNKMRNQWGPDYPIPDYFHEYPAAKEPLFIKYTRKKQKARKGTENNDIKKTSITKQKFEEDIAKREADLLIALNTKFKANPIPVSSLIPKYKMIMTTKGNKATEIRHKATEEKRAKIQAEMSYIVQDTIYEIQKEEAKRSMTKITSQTMNDAGNEGRRRRERLEKNEERAGLTDEHTFQPIVSKSIPDYKKLQAEFNAKLEKKKLSRPPIVPLEFKNVRQHQEEGYAQKMKKVKEILKIEKESIEKKKINRVPHYLSVIPSSIMVEAPHETKAWKLTIEHRKAQDEAKIERLKQEKEEFATKKERSKDMAAKLRAKLFLHDKQTSVRHNDNLQRLKNAQKQLEKEHKKRLTEMNERIDQRLALFEQSEIANAKGKAKREFRQVLEKEGLKGIQI